MKRKLAAIFVLFCMCLQNVNIAWAQNPVSISSQTITSGAVQSMYNWPTAEGNAKISVVTVDLTNPYTDLAVVAGQGQFGQRSSVSEMSARTQAIMMTNGDFFNMQAEGAPIGAVVMDGELVSSPSYINDVYSLGITSDRKAYIEPIQFIGQVSTKNGGVFALSGINKTYYWQENDNTHSHLGKMHLYTDMWGAPTRGIDSYAVDIAEALVQNGQVVAVKSYGCFDINIPKGVQLLHGDGKAANFLRALQIGDKIDINYEITPSLDWQMLIGGHGLLVQNGQAIEYTKDLSVLSGVRARTAVGISEDNTKLYIAAVEGKTQESVGLSLNDLANFMRYIGCYKALNLDGGGSTAMTVRNLGATDATRVINPEYNANERKVANGLALFSTAPQGKAVGINVYGNDTLFIGEQAEFTAGAWDEYYNPYPLDDNAISYSDTNNLGTWQGNVFTADKAGKTIITASWGNKSGAKELQVIGADYIEQLELKADKDSILSGGMAQITVQATLKDGSKKIIAPQLLSFQAKGGNIDRQGVLTATLPAGNVEVTAQLEHLTASCSLAINRVNQQYLLDNLDGVSSKVTPTEVIGSIQSVSDPAGSGKNVLKLNYNFSHTTQTAASYVIFDKDISISSNTKKLVLDVYGLGQNEWLRMELKDDQGNIHRYTLAEAVNWQGWKSVELDLKDQNINGDLKLYSIYVVANADENRQFTPDRSLYFSNLRLSSSQDQLMSILLKIGSNILTANGIEQIMDIAPFVSQNGRTMVPIRFVTEALDGEVVWNGEDRRVSLILGDDLIQMYIGENAMEVNGINIPIDEAAIIKNDRTLIPLRAVSEAFGLIVDYNSTDQSIMIIN